MTDDQGEILRREAQALGELTALHRDPVFYGRGVPRGDGRVVLVVPGLFGNDMYLQPLRVWLTRIGYSPARSTLSINAGCPDRLRTQVERSLSPTPRPASRSDLPDRPQSWRDVGLGDRLAAATARVAPGPPRIAGPCRRGDDVPGGDVRTEHGRHVVRGRRRRQGAEAHGPRLHGPRLWLSLHRRPPPPVEPVDTRHVDLQPGRSDRPSRGFQGARQVTTWRSGAATAAWCTTRRRTPTSPASSPHPERPTAG